MTEPQPITDEQLAELATALRARADWLDLPRNVEAPRPYISREQFRDAASLIAEVKRLRAVVAAMEWRPIETAPRGVNVIRYEPEERNRHGRESLHARIIISSGTYPRLASHWMPLPAPPQEKDHG